MNNQWSDDDVVRGLADMLVPTTLLKVGNNGKLGFRDFKLDDSFRSIMWLGKSKDPKNARVSLQTVKEIMFGQRSEKFRRCHRADLSTFSFSVVFHNRDRAPHVPSDSTGFGADMIAFTEDRNDVDTLDLVCPTERDFQRWTTCLLLLVNGKVSDDIMERARKLYKENSSAMKKGGNLQGRNLVRIPSALDSQGAQPGLDVYTFGNGEFFQNGVFDAINAQAEDVVQPTIVKKLIGQHILSVSLGYAHSTVLFESGKVLQFGHSVGTGFSDHALEPKAINLETSDPIVRISAGAFHNVAVLANGDAYSWGACTHGELGLGKGGDQAIPREIRWFDTHRVMVVEVACGESCTVVLSDKGEVYTFGRGEYGVLGHNDERDRFEPTLVRDLKGEEICKIACGSSHMFACTMIETYAWGWNALGQLGQGHFEDQVVRPHPIDVLRGKQVIDIDAGAAHSLAIVSPGKVKIGVIPNLLFVWGSNQSFQLGMPDKKNHNKPVPVVFFQRGSHELVSVAAGDDFSFVRSAEAVYGCGCNGHGQLGLGDKQTRREWAELPSLKERIVHDIVCGGTHTAVLIERKWMSDDEAVSCMKCNGQFTIMNRRHHCRNCWGIFCNSCSSKRMAILSKRILEAVRVCDACYEKLGGR